jgi:hypothetical protein
VQESDETEVVTIKGENSLLTPFAQLVAERTVIEHQGRPDEMYTGQVSMSGYQVLRDVS